MSDASQQRDASANGRSRAGTRGFGLAVGALVLVSLVAAGLALWARSDTDVAEPVSGQQDEVLPVTVLPESSGDDIGPDEVSSITVLPVVPLQSSTTELVVAAPALISGSVTTIDGAPVAAVQVELFVAVQGLPSAESAENVTTDADGSYEFEAPPGCYIVTVTAPAGTTLVGGGESLDSPVLCVDIEAPAEFSAELG